MTATNEPQTSIAAALLAFQAEAPELQRDKINPHFRSAYLSLETLMDHVLPVLNRAGIVVSQLVCVTDAGAPALRTVLLHAKSGESIESTMLLLSAKDDPQGQGSAITYARRYALMAALGLVADEDDDGNKASSPPRTARGARRGAAAPVKEQATEAAKPGVPPFPDTSQSPSGSTITETMRKAIFAAARAKGIEDSDLKTLISRVAGVSNSTKIPVDKADDVVAAIKAWSK